MWHGRTLVVATFLVAVSAAGCGDSVGSQDRSAPATPSATQAGLDLTQRNEGGEVTVEVTWSGPVGGAVFDVKLDTHSIDLDALDLSDAVLTNSRGETLVAIPWEAPTGGHHREGRLRFGGNSETFLADVSWIELTVKDVGGIAERVLRWEVPA